MNVPPESWPEYPYQPIFFNQRQFREDFAKKPVIKVFKDAINGVNAHFDRRYEEGEDIRFLVAERATFIDLILHYAWHRYAWGDDVCLIAVGGYGRRELHPHSDIDLLVLLANDAGNRYQEEIQSFITLLWDIGLEIGSSVRTLDECVAIAKQDITVATNLMEARRLAGNDRLRDQLQTLTGPDYMWPLGEFYRAKFEEQVQRHKKHNFTECNLEPNVKNSPGGLRDIQTIHWVAKRYYGVQTLRQLEGQSFFTEQEFGLLRNGEALLWRVRYGLHKMARRAEERLLFEYQRELAKQFGYKDNERGLAVEQFMHEYYRTVLALRELNDILLRILDERIHEKENKVAVTPSETVQLSADFQLRDHYIGVTHNRVFDERPAALMEIFVRMCEDSSIKGVQSQTIRLIREKRALVDEKFRQDPEIRAQFLRMFKIEKGLVPQLKRMKRYGILGRYLPAFGKITGQMQHDLFHRYTVDAHTLLVMQNIRRFRNASAEQDFPLAANIIKNLPQPELLYIAALFHDIGKGRGGDHSQLGAEDAELFCQEHGLNARETRLVRWLVEKHLLMSYVSQKKDISDPDVIHKFAQQVGDTTHLDYLYLLTVADMCGTNPEIWNSWRASLMRQLYTETKLALRRGLENPVDLKEVVEENRNNALAALAEKGVSEAEARAIWAEMRDDYFVREGVKDIVWQTEAILRHNSEEPLILIRDSEHQPWQGATQIFVRVKDVNNVFVAASTALAQLGLNIQDARIYSSKRGYTIDTFYVLDENYQPLGNDPAKLAVVHKALADELSLVDQYSEIVRRRTPRLLKQFATPTRTSIHNAPNSNVTALEVISPDRPGLLATIGRIFMEFGVQLQNAKISTLGERVEDIFFITDANKEPLTDPDLCDRLQQTICRELDLQVEKDI
ncbi:[protein-PII] uridylyltransferase [Saccharophagus sp. K07]|uniref:[protein-PII] uridylyltransferase n=1 Tax=Saccharophagus sp. K07 TaxID=2283636 RepID=UPI001652598D|nr:[protein-PII] uridylyltransferase [Saccharophagus sp. K07]MBC6904688.1 [protein-PII] uridylyltransferase [Saccharophagus sp. K07]